MSEWVGVILAAGRGKRMGTLGEDYPKPLLPVGNDPIIVHQLRLLRELDIREVFIVVGHRSPDVVQVVGDGSRFGLAAQYVEQHSSLGSAQALSLVRSHVQGPFVLMLGDYYFHTAQPRMLLQHFDSSCDGALLVKREANPKLIVEACEVQIDTTQRVTSITEKPMKPKSELKGCGFYAFQADFFDAVVRTPRTALRDEYELTTALELYVNSGKTVYAEPLPLDWDTNFTRPEDVLECNLRWLQHAGKHAVVADSASLNGAVIENAVVGQHCRISGCPSVKDAVVFDRTSLENIAVLEHVVATPHRVYHLDSSVKGR
jgi:dTDP-glucose pyrophosphorylase